MNDAIEAVDPVEEVQTIQYFDGGASIEKDRLRNIICDDDEEAELIEEEITDTSRWSVHHEAIFKLGGKFYRTHYSVGATEMQDERPYEYEGDFVDVEEVEPAEIIRTEYVHVGSKAANKLPKVEAYMVINKKTGKPYNDGARKTMGGAKKSLRHGTHYGSTLYGVAKVEIKILEDTIEHINQDTDKWEKYEGVAK